MELFRSLGALAESPTPETVKLAEILDLGTPPEVSQHTDLFSSKLYPYASVYLDTSGKLGGVARDRISGFWRVLGLEHPDESDHLAVLLSFYARLHELSEGAVDPDRRRWRLARVAFLNEHLLSWLPFYLDKLPDVAGDFYCRWAAVLTDALLDESHHLEVSESLPLHLRESTPIVDPRIDGGDAFLTSLLAPVRAGIILVRPDLERAGAGLDLGVRVGERKYVVKALLAQDAASTLNWLAQEADRWTDRHLRRVEWTGPIALFWANRARHTRDLVAELAGEAGRSNGP